MSRIAAIIGPLLGGVLAEYVNIRAPFYRTSGHRSANWDLVLYTMIRTGGDTVNPQGHRNVARQCGHYSVRTSARLYDRRISRRHLAVHPRRQRVPDTGLGDEMGLKTDQIGLCG